MPNFLAFTSSNSLTVSPATGAFLQAIRMRNERYKEEHLRYKAAWAKLSYLIVLMTTSYVCPVFDLLFSNLLI